MILVLALVCNMLPLQIFAAEASTEMEAPALELQEEQTAQTQPAYIVGELTENRTQYSKEFRLSNGNYLAAVYNEPVHYRSAGQWKDIDNTLKAKTDGTYTNTAGPWTVALPQKLDRNTPVTITKDGYTVSFTLSGQLEQLTTATAAQQRTMVLDGKTENLALSQASQATGQIQAAPSIPEGEQYPQTRLTKQNAGLLYGQIYANTDVRYDLQSTRLKESIILQRYNSLLRGYSYTLSTGRLIPRTNSDGSIDLLDEKGSPVMVIEAPYLLDANNVYNYDVQVTLSGGDGQYHLSYLLPTQWLAAADRAWPVVLDPVITADLDVNNVIDRTIATNATYPIGEATLECGVGQNGIHRIFLKYQNLPSLKPSDTIVGATVALCKAEDSGTAATVNVHKVDAEWETSTLTWASQPSYNTLIEDYLSVQDEGWYTWNVTDIVRGWYSTGKNTGMMFKVADESVAATWRQFFSSEYSGYVNPALCIYYRQTRGIEPYYTYQTMGAGHAGSAYLCDHTGQLKVMKNVAGYSSTVNPFSLNLVYNSDYFSGDATATDNIQSTHGLDMLFGNGFTLDIIQSIEVANVENALYDYLVYHDGDGTDHYLVRQSDGSYLDEDGLGLTATKSGNNFTMRNDQGVTWTFTDGLLSTMQDETGNKIIIDWITGNRGKYFYNIYQENAGGDRITLATVTYKSIISDIGTLTDAAGRVYTFTYDGDGNLTKITQRTTDNPQSTTDIAQYTYDGHQLTAMKDLESGYQLSFTYDKGKVNSYREVKDSETGAVVGVTYLADMTVYRDYGPDREPNSADDLRTYYSFDYWGRTRNACTKDATGKVVGATSATYSSALGDSAQQLRNNNRTQQTASIGVAAQNFLSNSGFESNLSGWTTSVEGSTASLTASTYTAHTGQKSLQGWMDESHTGTISAYTSATLTAGKTYTLSGYVNTEQVEDFGSGGIRLLVSQPGVTTWQTDWYSEDTDSQWERLSVSFTAPVSGSYSFMIQAQGLTGEFYADDFQLEEGEAPASYNLVTNGNMDRSDSWQYWGQMTYGWEGSDRYLRLQGAPTSDACAWQDIKLMQPSSQTYVLSGWAWADSVPDNDDAFENENYASDTVKRFGLQAILHYQDDSNAETQDKEYHYVPFCPDIHDWQFAAMTIVPKQENRTVSYIQVVLAYEKNANAVWFDDISLVKEVAQTMKYDEKGNLVSVATTGLEADTATYENGNLISMVTGANGTYSYNYEDTTRDHLLTSVSDGVVTQSYTYDGKGNTSTTTLTGGSNSLSTSAVYSADGNRLYTVTDANGSQAWYYYENAQSKMTGASTKVCTAPAGTLNNSSSDIAWQYTYNSYDAFLRTTSVQLESLAKVEYTYSNGNLSKLNRILYPSQSTQSYNFTYDSWGNNTSISVGEQSLATYTYGQNNGYLQSMRFGNGATVAYTYDNLGRIKTEVHTDPDETVTRTLTYTYTGDGQLYSIHDSKTGKTTRYTYDTLGRLIRSQDEDVRTSATYNSFNQLIRWDYKSKLAQAYETYSYDTNTSNGISDGTLTSMRTVAGDILNYTYDSLQRRTDKYITGKVWERYTYDDARVATKKNWMGNTLTHDFAYTYDTLGNIMTETENNTDITVSYTYDRMGQLTGAVRKDGNNNTLRTESYTYDNAGNILTFNNGSKSLTFGYSNGQWKDQLTSVTKDGKAHTITYDAAGNPLVYYNGYTKDHHMTWTEGRRLKTYYYNGATYAYEYNADGLRTKKTNPDGTYIEYLIADGRYLGEIHYTASNVIDLYIRYNYDESGSVIGISLWDEQTSTAWDTYYFVKSLQGDVLRIYRGSDSVHVATYDYDSWGNVTALGSVSYDGRTLCELNPFRYRGYYFDNESYFYYLQSRYYDPAIGRFISADVLASTGQGILGHNMYAYCLNNPVNRTDATGTAGIWFWLMVDSEWGFVHKMVQKHIESNNSGVITETGSKGLGRADVVRTGDGAVWEIKHAGSNPDTRCADAYKQAKKYKDAKCKDGTIVGDPGEAGAFSGTFCISIEGNNYEVNYRTPQEGVILYTVKETTNPADSYAYSYTYVPHAKRKENANLLNMGNSNYGMPTMIVAIPAMVCGAGYEFFGGGRYSTLQAQEK